MIGAQASLTICPCYNYTHSARATGKKNNNKQTKLKQVRKMCGSYTHTAHTRTFTHTCAHTHTHTHTRTHTRARAAEKERIKSHKGTGSTMRIRVAYQDVYIVMTGDKSPSVPHLRGEHKQYSVIVDTDHSGSAFGQSGQILMDLSFK